MKHERIKNKQALEALRKKIVDSRDPKKPVIAVCGGPGCLAYGCQAVANACNEVIEKEGLKDKVTVRVTGCQGFCERGPLMLVYPQKVFYPKVKPEDVKEIILETAINGKPVERLLYEDLNTKKKYVKEEDVPFYAMQHRLLMNLNSQIEATSIEDYLSIGGYSALAKALFEMKPEGIIDEVKKSGLRGRGGGGFATGRKWESCRKAHGTPKYVICNADEGDPGAFMDRALLEGNPHSILEGMLIAAFAIGSNEGYMYVRNEYPLAVKHTQIAIEQAENLGLIGKNILGSGFDFKLSICRGGGAFVCGESTALMASLEGKAGEPRAKYIHTVDSGLWGKPSNLNNVETYANVPHIINNGSAWYSKIGAPKSTGTKIFSLVGKINNTGLVEIPMGVPLRKIIEDVGGGIPKGKKFKAVQTGGPSGGCIPEKFLDEPVEYDTLTKIGSMMGSGGMIVMDENNCMVDVARYFIDFLKEESCGKCTPCREGLKQMSGLLSNICQGKGKEGDVELLERLSEAVVDASLCALGGSAPNPVLSTIKYFREEYDAHIKDKHCPAKVCKSLIKYKVIEKECIGCTKCAKVCPSHCIAGATKKAHVIDQTKCIRCGICLDTCPVDAIEVK